MGIEKLHSDLQNVLLQMHQKYVEDPMVAVRGQYFIRLLHGFCKRQLISFGFPNIWIKGEVELYGAYKRKKVDVAVVHPDAGPLVVITVRSQMSSIAKNVDTNIEGLVGDATNLHLKYPTLVLAHLLLWPKIGFKKDEKPPFDKMIPLLKGITNRLNSTGPPGKYEEIAFLVVDFSALPPQVVQDIPAKDSDLRIENFFENVFTKFRERNLFIKLK